MSGKNEKLRSYSFVLAIFVVALHCIAFITDLDNAAYKVGTPTYSFFHFFLVNVFVPITDIAVPSFFAISGYLFSVNYTFNDTLRKFKSRIKTLVIPYLVWNVISVAWYMTMYKIAPNASHVDSPFEIKNLLLGIFFFKYNYFWFIGALIVYQAISPILYLFFRHKATGIALIFFVYLLYLKKVCYVDFPFTYSFFSVVMYMIGLYCGIHWKKMLSISYRKSLSGLALLGFVSLLTLYVFVNANLQPNDLFEKACSSSMFYLLGGVLMWISYDLLGRVNNYWFFSLSFFIYAVHMYVQKITCIAIQLVLSKVIIDSDFCEITQFVFSWPLSILGCIWVAKTLKSINPKAYNILSGGR